jgi:fluoride ion exporter CrcB/FEX
MKVNARIIALTFVGGFVGTAFRFFLNLNIEGLFQGLWVANLLGAVAIAVFLGIKWFNSDSRRAFFVTGFSGGFTTMSGLTLLTFYSWYGVLAQVMLGVLIYLATRWLIARFTRA